MDLNNGASVQPPSSLKDNSLHNAAQSAAGPGILRNPSGPSWRNMPPGGALIFLGIAWAALGQLAARDLPEHFRWQGTFFLLIGIVTFLAGAWALQRRESIPSRIPDTVARLWNRWSDWLGISASQAIFLTASPLFACLACIANGNTALMPSPAAAVISWALGIICVIAGGWSVPAVFQKIKGRTHTWIWFLLVSAFALIIRMIDLGSIPVVLTGDEGSGGLYSLHFLDGTLNNLFGVYGFPSFPSLYYFLVSISISVLGRTTEALRMPSVIAGSLAVGVLYLVGRAMFGHRPALVAAFFLAALHHHVHFSRLGLNNIFDSLAFTVALGALWHGWKYNRRSSFLLAGLALGLSQYFYATARILLPTFVLVLLAATLLDRRQWKSNLPHIVCMLLTAFVCCLPLFYFAFFFPNEYAGPINASGISNSWLSQNSAETGLSYGQLLLQQLLDGFSGFANSPLRFWYQPGTPILRPIPATIFFLGAGLLLLRARDLRTWVLAVWIVIMGFVSALSESAPAAQRLTAVDPALALIVGFGLVETAQLIGRAWPHRVIIFALTAVLAVGITADDLRFYFLEYTPASHFTGAHDFEGFGAAVANALVRQLGKKDASWEVCFLSDGSMGWYSIPSLQYLRPLITGNDYLQPWGDPKNPIPKRPNLLFVFLDGRINDLPAIMAQYPGGTEGKVAGWNNVPLYSYYEYKAISP